MISSELPDNDATLDDATDTTETNDSIPESSESSREPASVDEDDHEDEVEVIYVGAPTRFFDPASMDDPEHDAPRPSSIPRRARRAEIRDQFDILREAATLSKGRMDQLNLPAHLRQLLSEVKAAEEHKGSRRFIRAQLSRMTEEDTDTLADALDRLPELDREAAEKAKRADLWARVLIDGGKTEQTQFFDLHQDQSLDHQSLRSMIRQTAKNVKKLGLDHDKSKRSLKDLRKSLRAIALKPCTVKAAPTEE